LLSWQHPGSRKEGGGYIYKKNFKKNKTIEKIQKYRYNTLVAFNSLLAYAHFGTVAPYLTDVLSGSSLQPSPNCSRRLQMLAKCYRQ